MALLRCAGSDGSDRSGRVAYVRTGDGGPGGAHVTPEGCACNAPASGAGAGAAAGRERAGGTSHSRVNGDRESRASDSRAGGAGGARGSRAGGPGSKIDRRGG